MMRNLEVAKVGEHLRCVSKNTMKKLRDILLDREVCCDEMLLLEGSERMSTRSYPTAVRLEENVFVCRGLLRVREECGARCGSTSRELHDGESWVA